MRQIKFRAWDKTTNEMKEMAWVDHYMRYPSRFEIMQYTGLHDRDAREIYEGDILRWNNGCPEMETQDGTYIVIWDEENAHFGLTPTKNTKPTGWGTAYNRHSWKHYMRVIGNIYENPEAVKA